MNGSPRFRGAERAPDVHLLTTEPLVVGTRGPRPRVRPAARVQCRPGEETRLRVRKPGPEPQLHHCSNPNICLEKGGGDFVQRPALQERAGPGVRVSERKSGPDAGLGPRCALQVSLDAAVRSPPVATHAASDRGEESSGAAGTAAGPRAQRGYMTVNAIRSGF